MIQTVVSVVVLLAHFLAVWLLPKYLERRVAEAARGAVDVSVGKTLADHKLNNSSATEPILPQT
jgi:hypothetical protein